MTDTINTTLAAVMALSVRDFENGELAALHLALNWPGKPAPAVNRGYPRALKLHLINEDGSVPDRDELLLAVSHEVGRRVEAGTFT